MPKRMDNLTMNEISLVDRGANLIEGWMVMKSATPAQMGLMNQALAVAKGEAPTQEGSGMPIDVENADPAVLKAYIAGLESRIAGQSAAPALPTAEDRLAKQLAQMPDDLREIVAKSQRDAAEARDLVRKAEEREERAGYTALVKSMDHLPGVNADTAELVFKAKHGDSAAVDQLLELMNKANSMAKAVGSFSEIGSSRVSEDSAEGRFDSVVKSVQAESPNLTYEDAVVKAAKSNPAAYHEYRRSIMTDNAMGAK